METSGYIVIKGAKPEGIRPEVVENLNTDVKMKSSQDINKRGIGAIIPAEHAK